MGRVQGYIVPGGAFVFIWNFSGPHKHSRAGTRGRVGTCAQEGEGVWLGSPSGGCSWPRELLGPAEVLLSITPSGLSPHSQPSHVGPSLPKWITPFCSLLNLSNFIVNSEPVLHTVSHTHPNWSCQQVVPRANRGHIAQTPSVLLPATKNKSLIHLNIKCVGGVWLHFNIPNQ